MLKYIQVYLLIRSFEILITQECGERRFLKTFGAKSVTIIRSSSASAMMRRSTADERSSERLRFIEHPIVFSFGIRYNKGREFVSK